MTSELLKALNRSCTFSSRWDFVLEPRPITSGSVFYLIAAPPLGNYVGPLGTTNNGKETQYNQ